MFQELDETLQQGFREFLLARCGGWRGAGCSRLSWLLAPQGSVHLQRARASAVVALSSADRHSMRPARRRRRGVNEDLGEYLRHLMFDKEQTEYMGWLQRVHEFVAK